MPELPEVETVRRQLVIKILKRPIVGGRVYKPKVVKNDPRFIRSLVGYYFSAIDRVGKLMIFTLEHPLKEPKSLLAHLKMTGQFFFVDTGKVLGGGHTMTQADIDLPNKHTRVQFDFEDGTTLHFNDMRLFGYIHKASQNEVVAARAKYGPEPIADNFPTDDFYGGIKRRHTTIKAVLLDQSFVAGLGNIYVDEALWHAAVRPTRRASTLTKAEVDRVAHYSRHVLQQSIDVGGTTFQHFKDTGGENGNYTDYLKVFGKQKTPCPRCGAIIKKIRCAGRGTHYCSSCQK